MFRLFFEKPQHLLSDAFDYNLIIHLSQAKKKNNVNGLCIKSFGAVNQLVF